MTNARVVRARTTSTTRACHQARQHCDRPTKRVHAVYTACAHSVRTRQRNNFEKSSGPSTLARATWHPVRDLNPCYQDENLASWAARRTGQVVGVARGGGLEPPITGPEPVVLPITPPPNG